jgi:hypothetical protein
MRKHTELGMRGGTKRGHYQQNLELEITACVTIWKLKDVD